MFIFSFWTTYQFKMYLTTPLLASLVRLRNMTLQSTDFIQRYHHQIRRAQAILEIPMLPLGCPGFPAMDHDTVIFFNYWKNIHFCNLLIFMWTNVMVVYNRRTSVNSSIDFVYLSMYNLCRKASQM